MHLSISIAFAVGGSVVAAIALRATFRGLAPDIISQYRACAGGWWEAELNNCRAGLQAIPQQPVNTYTNVAYATAGLFLAFSLNTLPTYVLSLGLLYLCAGSSLYHATSTRWGGCLDVSAIYALFSALAAYSVLAVVGLEEPLRALIMFVAGAVLGYLLRYQFRGNLSLRIGAFLVVTYSCTVWNMVQGDQFVGLGWLIASLALFVVGYVAWNLDKARSFPLRRWGHGIWHICTAAGIPALFFASYLADWPAPE